MQGGELTDKLTKALEDVGGFIVSEAKLNLHNNDNVDNGDLINSITHKVQGHVLSVGTSVFYAPYVEFGTGKYAENGQGRKTPWKFQDPKTGAVIVTHGSRPYPYLRPAFYENKRQITEIIKKAFRAWA